MKLQWLRSIIPTRFEFNGPSAVLWMVVGAVVFDPALSAWDKAVVGGFIAIIACLRY